MRASIGTRLRSLGTLARERLAAVKLAQESGLLGAIEVRGLTGFARKALRMRSGPHLAILFHAQNTPDKVALVDGRRTLTYAQLDREINQLAHALVSLGVTPGDRVAIMLPNHIEHVVAQYAIPRIGATAVEIGYRLREKEVAFILEHSGPHAVLYHRSFAETMVSALDLAGGPPSAQLVVCGAGDGRVPGHAYGEILAEYSGERAPAKTRRTTAGAIIVYTSGTTGNPKGAQRNLDGLGLEAAIDMMTQIGMRHDDRHLVVCPLYHSAAPAFVGMMLVLGATMHIMEHFDADEVLATISREKITSTLMVPTMLSRLCDATLPPDVDLSSMRWVCSGAAPLSTNTAARLEALFGLCLWNFYGATETGLVSLAGPYDHQEHPGTVGRPLTGNEIRILDEDGDIVETGDVGELYARNTTLFAGYHKNVDATRSSSRDGFFSVGDLARMDSDGYIYLESRKHDMVISGGVNIYPREIENLLHSHPEILEAAVLGVPDEEWGESIKAFVVRRPGSNLTEADVISFCRSELADYKRPRFVSFLDVLPRNPTGKILKRQLREL